MLDAATLESYRPLVRRVVAGMIPAPDRPDLVQMSLLKAWRYRESARGATVAGWIVQLTRCECIDWLRQNARQVARAELPEEHGLLAAGLAYDPAAERERAERARLCREAVDHLSPAYRDAVRLVCLEGYTEAEAAALLQISIGTVKSRLFRGRRMLRERIAPRLAGEV